MTPAQIIDTLRSHPLASASAAVVLVAIGIHQIVGSADNRPDELDLDDDFAFEVGVESIGRVPPSVEQADTAAIEQPRFGESATMHDTHERPGPERTSRPFDDDFPLTTTSEVRSQIRTAGFETNQATPPMRRPAAWLTGTIEDIDESPTLPTRTASSQESGPASARY